MYNYKNSFFKHVFSLVSNILTTHKCTSKKVNTDEISLVFKKKDEISSQSPINHIITKSWWFK